MATTTPPTREHPSPYRMAEGSEGNSIIRAEIAHLDDEICALSQRRSQLQQNLSHRISPLYRLPSDVLAEIFKYFVLTPKDLYRRGFNTEVSKDEHREPYVPDYPRLLSRVCVRWREITLSNPILWSVLVLAVSSESELKCAATLKMFLKHSSPLPFYLELTILNHTMPKSEKIPVSIENTLFYSEHISRISGLYLSRAPWEWFSCAEIGWLTSLRELRWSNTRRGDKTCSRTDTICNTNRDNHSPLQESLSLNSLCVAHSGLPTNFSLGSQSRITVLCAHDITTADTITLLRQCPQLVEFHFSGHGYTRSEDEIARDLIHLPHLRVFGWRCISYPFLPDILRFSSVEKIAFKVVPKAYSGPGNDPYTLLINFFERLPPTVTHLELSYSVAGQAVLEQVIPQLSNVQHFALWAPLQGPPTYLASERKPNTFSIGTPPGDGRRMLAFPKLSRLVVYPSRQSKYCIFRPLPALVDLIEEQGRTSETPFHLVVGGGAMIFEGTDDEEMKERYHIAQSEGKLTISYRKTWRQTEIEPSFPSG